jgi:hypothetical protein
VKSRRNKFPALHYPRCTIAASMLAAIIGVGAAPQLANAEGIDWTIAPYLWAADVGLDVRINNDPVIGADVAFSDLVDKLDGAFMGHIEMSDGQYGAFFDAIYIDLADSAVIPVGPGGPIIGDLLVDTDLTLKLYELGGFYRMGSPDPGSSAFDIVLGVRQVDVDQSLDIVLPGPGATPINRNLDVSETDIFAGARLIGLFSEKWHYKLRADYGGGGTEGTLNALAAVGYAFGKTGLFSIDVGYRYLSIELKNESNGTVTETDLTLSGPLVGFIFTF